MPHHYVLMHRESRLRYYMTPELFEQASPDDAAAFDIERRDGELEIPRMEPPLGSVDGDLYTDEDSAHRA